ncbi:fatty acid-binding protein, brain [Pangasianodon hypophthalmus]|uniref:fatty acid-binding protein, brain n=1 Tax=Pangasianodon hypophthalmus TaxID=310915 RepID=UPI00147CF55E|nr:fatty acid-binding protein, brain [Pangasianodon hypophthalmus]
MEAFIGTWKLIQDENYHKYLRAIGAEEEVIAVSDVLKPVVTVSQEDDIVVIKIQSSIGTEELSFKLGRAFYLKKIDCRYCKVVVDLEGNQLIQVDKWDNKESTSIYEVKDGKLIKTMTFKDITAVQTFTRV